MAAARQLALFESSLVRYLRVPLLALMTILFVAGPLMAAPSYAQANHPNHEPNQPTSPLDSCSISQFSYCIAGIFYLLFVALTAEIAYFGGVIFDYVAALALEGGTYADSLINKGWTIARDVANMAFVLLLIFMAFQLILNIEGVGVGKTLAKLIIVALLINFSFFFSRVVIDASNLLAHQFYDHIKGRPAVVEPGSAIYVSQKPLQVKHVSENIMNGLGVQQVLSNKSFEAFYKQGNIISNSFILIGLFFIFGVINLILSFVFFTAAIQFLARIVSLWMAVILSPIGFISFVIPGLSGLSKSWWTGLIKNAFFAPAFLFFFYILVTFLDAGLLASSVGNALYSGQITNTTGGSVEQFFRPLISIMIRLFIVVGLLMAALKVGEYFGQTSAKSILGGAVKYGGALAGAGLGMGAWAGRKTLGRLAYEGSRSEGLRDSARSGSRASLYTWKALEKVSGASFDVRAVAPLTSSALGLGKASPGVSAADRAERADREYVRLKDTVAETARKGELTEDEKRAKNLDVIAQQATVNVGENLQVASALRDVADSVRQVRDVLQPALKDLEKEAGRNQADAKIDASVATRQQELKEKDERAKADADLHSQLMGTTGVGEIGKFIKEEEDKARAGQLHEATNLGSAVSGTQQASAPPTERSDAPTLQQEKDSSIAAVERLGEEARRAAERGTIDKRLDDSGSSADSPKPAPQDGGSQSEKADA